MNRWLAAAAAVLVSCSNSGDGQAVKREPEPKSAAVFVDFDPYEFVDANASTASTLRRYILTNAPSGVEVLDVTVRSVEEDGEPVPAEAVGATLDKGKLEAAEFYPKVLRAIAGGQMKPVLGGDATLVKTEGTIALLTFLEADVLVYLIGQEAEPLKEIAQGLLQLNGI